ncbi:hypothetical protein BBJ28_00015265 [Nothophytophthora sp. Chile5]|nr:hypothetical protein BBJ28_00015265 [Nothophytophthora sp. Chile5]
MDWTIQRDLPINEVPNKSMRAVVTMKPTTVGLLKQYMSHVTGKVGRAIAAEMGSSFSLMFDGWMRHSNQCLGLYAVYMVNGERRQLLLALSPMDAGQIADAHLDHIESVLDLYGKELAMVCFLVDSNCSTDQSVATKLRVPLIGCASHLFDLAVYQVLEDSQTQIDLIHSLMIQLRQVKNATTLSKATRLKPIKTNATRWSATFLMLQRYVKIRDTILTVNTVEEYVPRGNAHHRIVALIDKLEELDSVCVKLQAEQRTLAEVCLLFNACVEKIWASI